MPAWSSPVRYVECDQQGIVFNAHYLTWADEAVMPVLGALGTPYRLLQERDLEQVVVATTLSWTASARWGDTVEVDGAVESIGRTSFVMVLTIAARRDDEPARPCCTVRTTYVMLGEDSRPVAVPDDLRARWITPT